MPKKTFLLISFLVIITVVLVFIAIKTEQIPSIEQTNKTSPSSTTTPSSPAHTSLLIQPSEIILDNQNQQTVDVLINTNSGNNSNRITAVQLEIGYDPEVLQGVSIINGSFFTSPMELLNKIDTKTGRITYAIALKPDQSSLSGQGTVAKIIFSKLQNPSKNETLIEILPKSLVTAEGVSQSVLKSTSNLKITVE